MEKELKINYLKKIIINLEERQNKGICDALMDELSECDCQDYQEFKLYLKEKFEEKELKYYDLKTLKEINKTYFAYRFKTMEERIDFLKELIRELGE